jgi:hypothetical protein
MSEPPRVVRVDPDPNRRPVEVRAGRNDDGSYNVAIEIGGTPYRDACDILLVAAASVVRQSECATAAFIVDGLEYMRLLMAAHACQEGDPT